MMEKILAWMAEEGFCGTCAYFYREPRCQGGICGFYPGTPQMKLDDSCEEYSVNKEWVMHFVVLLSQQENE